MDDASNAAAWNAAGQVAAAGLNYAATTNINKKTRKYNEQMYEKQKADQLAFWNMQNEYNNPVSQMERLRQAGLNPNLVYGASAPGNSSGSLTPGPAPRADLQTPRFDLATSAASVINTYYDVKMKQAQYDNLKADNTIKFEQAKLMEAQRLNQLLGLEKGRFNFDLDKTYSKDMREAQVNNLYYRGQLTNSQSYLVEANRDYLEKTLGSRINQQNLNEEIKSNMLLRLQLENQLRQNGVQPNDPFYIRMMNVMFGEKVNQVINKHFK